MHFDLVYTECNNASLYPTPVAESFITAALSAVLLVVTVPTNFLVCLAIIIDPNKRLKTQFNCLTFNLALADLLVGCVTESVSIYVHIEEGVYTEQGNDTETRASKVLNIQYFVSVMASLLSILALALERYLAVTRPFFYRQYFSVGFAMVMSVIIWSIALAFGLMNIFIEYILASFIFVNTAVLLTGAVVAFVCFRIFSTLRKNASDWTAPEENRENAIKGNSVQRKVTKTFALIVGALMCCYIPACSMIYFMNFCQNCDCDLVQWFRDAAFWLVLLNSAINPFVYAIRSNSYRKAISKILHSGWRSCHFSRRKQRKGGLNADFTSIQGGREQRDTRQSSGYGSL